MKIPAPAARALSLHVSRAVERLDPARYRQEAAYVAALFARLDAVVYRGSNFTLELKSTVVCDRGPNSAESKWGADFGIVASMISKEETAEKGVLGQAKRGSLIELVPSQAETFRQQVLKMSAATTAMVGLEVPTSSPTAPTVRILEVPVMHGTVPIQHAFRTYEHGIKAPNPAEPLILVAEAVPLGRYLHAELIRCLHGDANRAFVSGLADSSLTTLRVEARTIQ